MKNLVAQYKNFCIYNVGKEYLYDVVKFVIFENYKHHSKVETVENIDEEITSIYEDELSFAETSQIYVAEDNEQRMIGCIRVFRWDKKIFLPTHKIFNINPLNNIQETLNSSFWHIVCIPAMLTPIPVMLTPLCFPKGRPKVILF